MIHLIDLAAANPFWTWAAVGAALLAAEVATGSGWLLWPAASAGLLAVLSLALPLGWLESAGLFAVLTIATSLAAHGVAIEPAPFLETLAESFARWLARWRNEGVPAIRDRWVARAHPPGTALTARLPDGTSVDGLFERLDAIGRGDDVVAAGFKPQADDFEILEHIVDGED